MTNGATTGFRRIRILIVCSIRGWKMEYLERHIQIFNDGPEASCFFSAK